MESSADSVAQQRQQQLAIRKQIAELQAQLADIPEEQPRSKRKSDESTFVPKTPSPKKKRRMDDSDSLVTDSHHRALFTSAASSSTAKQVKIEESESSKSLSQSNLLSTLSGVKHGVTSSPSKKTRSTDFKARPAPTQRAKAEETDIFMAPVGSSSSTTKRDDNLAVIEELQLGPYDHKPPFDDPLFEQIEPHSGIRLSTRVLSYDDLQNHLYNRYYLSPSKLYSVVRLSPDRQAYDVPVEGDWVTIAVVAERGEIKYTRPPVAVNDDEEGGDTKSKKKQKKAEEARKPRGKKYVNLKLVDFGTRSKSSTSTGKAVIRGDALLSLLLFEADSFDTLTRPGQKRTEKVYKGGSGGAFEALSKVKEGDVIALLNPKILRPFQKSGDRPHPQSNILALTPESASSIAVIGRSKDLGLCGVIKKDGEKCSAWCDKRVSDVCEYHVQTAVQRQRAGRAEFAVGTGGMTATAKHQRKDSQYDPRKQWGLTPERDEGATYCFSGHTVRGSTHPNSIYISENIGREGQAKAARRKTKDEEKALAVLLSRDKEGMQTVVKAREYAELQAAKRVCDTNPKGTTAKLGEDIPQERDRRRTRSSLAGQVQEISVECKELPVKRKSFPLTTLRQIGYDPAAIKNGAPRQPDHEIAKKLQALEKASSRKEITLRPSKARRMTTKTETSFSVNGGEATAVKESEDVSMKPPVDLDEE